ncbi:lipoamide acyltransferase component of branched-chain alpha-keto acid dehydrogenase complex [Aliidongia dinghuensis]|uniref:Dihydrolipoamide acetyltransferase component of pyruvate dehydrogenase complex n=1 Tax=Aliidongia dinghuensis TaxID=1867774 RepID=A0A8J2YSR7_9PROT|nr:dihydrolipoamide acetyltransferase family protein [Aliidongia dinghuensis]GGF15758.1 lipoamide acyltransferase component of branched-chain alpha-keto acid dehydrogenase complex [Aliidongia dinghuensis]
MGLYSFKLPDVGEGTAEAEIAAWHVKVGDLVTEDQHLVDIMTDKAVVEISSPVAGKILVLHGDAGQMRPVGSTLIEFEIDGVGNAKAEAPKPASVPAVAPAPAAAPSAPQAPVAAKASEPAPRPALTLVSPPVPTAPAAVTPAFATRLAGDKPQASPAVRQRAWDLGIELQFVPGTGPAGRITHADLDAFVAAGGTTAVGSVQARALTRDGVEEIKVIGLRRKIAEKMQEAKRRIPHFSYVEEVDVTALEELRQHLNGEKKDRPKLTLLPFLLRAMVKALPDFPQINARFDDDAGVVHRHAAVHAGIATQTPSGLVVPVVAHAEALDLWQAAAEIARLATAARDGKATREELSGSTITITSLGPMGGIVSTPVINRPEVAIVGVNKIVERPMVRGGQIVVRKMMNLSSSFDHRVVDGWDAAEFIQRIRGLLEQPATLFMD